MGNPFETEGDEYDEALTPTRIDYAAHMRRSPVVSTFVVNAALLRDAANDLDWSARYAELKFSPNASPNFSLSMSSEQTGVSVSVSWPRSSEMFTSFDAKQSQEVCYNSAALAPALRALSCATDAQIRVADDGLLQLRLLVPITANKTRGAPSTYANYYVMPLVDRDDFDAYGPMGAQEGQHDMPFHDDF
jgi:hypothetical protein